MVDYTLQHLIYGTAVVAGTPSDETDILAISDPLSPNQVKQLLDIVAITPMPISDIKSSQAVAMVNCRLETDMYYVIARAHFQEANQTLPVRQFLLIPQNERTIYQNFEALINLFQEPIPLYSVTNSPLDRLQLSHVTPPSKDKQVMVIKSLLDELMDNDFGRLVGILSQIINGKVIVRNFPQDTAKRLLLVRGLRLLVPNMLRSALTFTTYIDNIDAHLPRLTFSDAEGTTSATVIDWQDLTVVDASTLHTYATQINHLWNNTVIDLVDTIQRYNEIANVAITVDHTLDRALTIVAERHQLDLDALQGKNIGIEQVLSVFESDIPMSIPLQTAYAILLLEANFESRDTTTAKSVATVIADNTDLNTSLEPFISTSIEEQPDAVYAFVRTHLHTIDDENITPRWLTRLHDAAQASINVAIESKDAATIRSWLTLISREPLRYELSDILQKAILDALPYVDDSPELAQEILEVAVKRQPEMVADLLANETLTSALPESVQQALLEHDYTALEQLVGESRTLFLLGVHQAIQAQASAVSSICVRALWQIFMQHQTSVLPTQFRSATLIQDLLQNPTAFYNGAYGTFLTLALAHGEHDALFYDAVPAVSTYEEFSDALAQALEQSQRDTTAVLDILSTLVAKEAITPQIAINTLSTMLVNQNWNEAGLPYVEQLARLMSQHPSTTTTLNVLWKLNELSEVQKNEQMLKVSLRRLLDITNDLISEAQIVENIKTIRRNSQWSTTGKSVVVRWWRQFAREQGMGQLQKIEKLLEGNRSLEDLRAIAQTSIAMRRIIGNRTLEEFAEAVASTYALLQALSEGFDPTDKLVDSTTIRNEIDARAEELPPNLRPVLSTNLRELAQLVTVLSENRSKPSIIRSDDALERQLATGEQDPTSAIDVIRWLSGYLDGMQKNDNE